MPILSYTTATNVQFRDPGIRGQTQQGHPQDASACLNALALPKIGKMPRKELEDRFLRLHEETLQLKKQGHQQEDGVKRLKVKLMRLMKLMKDHVVLEPPVGRGQPSQRLRYVEMTLQVEELQEKVVELQKDKEKLKQHLLDSRRLLNTVSQNPKAYSHVQSRVNCGQKQRRGSVSSQAPAKCSRHGEVEGDGTPYPRHGHKQLEEAKARILNLDNIITNQSSWMEEMQQTSEQLKEELRQKEAQYEEKLLQLREQLRSHVSSNIKMAQMQKQLTNKSRTAAELEGQFLQLQKSQETLKFCHNAAMEQVDQLAAQLKSEKLKRLNLEDSAQHCDTFRAEIEQLQQKIGEVEEERDQLEEENHRLVHSVTQQQERVTQQKERMTQQQERMTQQQERVTQQQRQLKAVMAQLHDDRVHSLDEVLKRGAGAETSHKLKEENTKFQREILQLDQRKGHLKSSNKNNIYTDQPEYFTSFEPLSCQQSVKSSRGRKTQGHFSCLVKDIINTS